MRKEGHDPSSIRETIKGRIDIVEETYDAMLRYAAQGLTGNEPGGSAAELRGLLEKTDTALTDLVSLLSGLSQGYTPKDAYESFIEVLDRDVRAARAGIQLALAREAISSQLIDNMNAWIHLRALLTDLFVLDEILGAEVPEM